LSATILRGTLYGSAQLPTELKDMALAAIISDLPYPLNS
jgi:hypothetical protein